ncbi:MAG TPA: hypothetical protein VFB99_21165 [Vicinamibacterales bacterium]|nr:hypothetical protein [Vicinamibacterales bacterium]
MACENCTRDLAKYPWDKCIRDQRKRGYSKGRAEKICGYIKDKYGSSTDAVPEDAHLEAAKALELEPDELDAPPDVATKDLKGLDTEAISWITKAGTEPEQPDNPPEWARDKAKWERAKAAVKKYWSKYSEPCTSAWEAK